MNGKIWIDLTDLMQWNGHFTGTQRVTYEISKRYHEKNDNVRFFYYDQNLRLFFETNLELSKYEDNVYIKPVDSNFINNIKESFISKFIVKYNSLPLHIKNILTINRIKLLIRKYISIKQRIQNIASIFFNNVVGILKPNNKLQAINFQNEDTVIILGKPWDTMSFIEDLKIMKIQNSFKLINLIYDMIPTFMPHLFGYPLPQNYTKYMFESISLSNSIIAISKNTKKDIELFCKEILINVPPIEIIKLGVNKSLTLPKKPQILDDLKFNNYILCVGTLEIRKNHQLLYNAYREAYRIGVKLPKLIICGGRGWYTEDIIHEINNDPVVKDSILIINSPTDSEILWLYKNCKFTVYPSVYEGWGLPIAESLYHGKFCISSSTSSMPEIAGSLLEYFSPYDAKSCMDLIVKYSNKKNLEEKEFKIKEYKYSSWDDTYNQFSKILNKTE